LKLQKSYIYRDKLYIRSTFFNDLRLRSILKILASAHDLPFAGVDSDQVLSELSCIVFCFLKRCGRLGVSAAPQIPFNKTLLRRDFRVFHVDMEPYNMFSA
jgi:hypothetical protein